MNTLTDACCDRCGMLYLEDHEHITAIGGKRVNLCPECREKLDAFMKMEDVEVMSCKTCVNGPVPCCMTCRSEIDCPHGFKEEEK